MFIIALEKMHILVENRKWVVWEAKDRFCIFAINIPNWLSKTMQRVCSLVFHILWELRVQILKITRIKQKDRRLFPCLLYALFSMECSLPKVLQKCSLNQIDIRFIMELCKLHKIVRKATRCSLQSKTQTLFFQTNYSKLALKHYIGALQHSLPYSV